MKRAILFVTFAALCGAQTTVNGGRDYKGTLKASGSVSAVDFSSAGGTAPVKAGTSASRPTGCTQGQIYFATDVTAGQNLYFCTVTGTPGVWTQMSGEHDRRQAAQRTPAYISIRFTRRARTYPDISWRDPWICHDGLDGCGLRQCFATQCHQCYLCCQSFDLRCDDHVCQSAEQLLCGG